MLYKQSLWYYTELAGFRSIALNQRRSFHTVIFRAFASKNSPLPSNGQEESSLLSETIKSLTAQGVPDAPSTKNLPKPPIMARIKEGLLHYWHGSKLLAYETKISSKLLFKLIRGEQLIRRERKQLLRTTSDLFRLVPFIVIAIIPFLEFALPVLLKLFPNMLPSTFEDKVAAVRSKIHVRPLDAIFSLGRQS